EKTLGLLHPEHELLLNLGDRFLFAVHLVLPTFQFSRSPEFRGCGPRRQRANLRPWCPRQALEARRNGESRGGSTADGARPSVGGCPCSPREESARPTSGRAWERTKAKPLARRSASISGRARRSARRRSPADVAAGVECLQRGHEFCGRSEQRALRGGRRRLAREPPERVRPFSLVLFEPSRLHCRVHLACASQSLARKTSRAGPRAGTRDRGVG